jgi:hypothetical protein
MTDGTQSQPIIDRAYRLTLEINAAVVKLPRHQRPGLGRRMKEAAFDLIAALVKARYLRVGQGRGAQPRLSYQFAINKELTLDFSSVTAGQDGARPETSADELLRRTVQNDSRGRTHAGRLAEERRITNGRGSGAGGGVP